MTSTPDIRFSHIREHETSQQRAWEELAYILAADLDSLPSGTHLVRRGTPDGGIEFSCPAPPGQGKGVWAWQAKFLFTFGPPTFGQMKASVENAVAHTPGLSKYIFVMPADRPDGPAGVSAMKKWHENTARWKQAASQHGADVEFAFHGHSDVLKALLHPRHAAVARYFFDTTFLTPEALAGQVSRAIDDLGQRYDPDLHVQTEFPALVSGLCIDSDFTGRVGRLLAAAEERTGWAGRLVESDLSDPVGGSERVGEDSPAPHTGPQGQRPGAIPGHPGPEAGEAAPLAVGSAIGKVLTELEAAVTASRHGLGRHDLSALSAMRAVLERCSRAVAADSHAAERRAAKPAGARREPSEASQDSHRTGRGPEAAGGRVAAEDLRRALSAAERALDAAARFLDSREVRAAERGAVLLIGPAGCGKSHSVADVSRARISAGAPTVLVLGQQLSNNTSVGVEIGHFLQLGLPWNELLGALQVAAQVTGKGRALLAIDAVNEGPGAELWTDRMSGFLREIREYPLVAVLISVRDTYESAIVPASASTKVVRTVHPGLAGHESEAIQLYASHYDLQVSNVPILHPEFTNPLLLRSVCRAAHARGLTAFPTTAMGPNWVFSGLLDDANNQVSATLDRDVHDHVVHQSVRILAQRMLEGGIEALPYAEARSACRNVHEDHGRMSNSLLNALERQGLLLRERLPRGASPADGHAPTVEEDQPHAEQVRFTYQRMADHLRAQELLSRHTDQGDIAEAIGALIADHAWRESGLIEALSALVPDLLDRELLDLLDGQEWVEASRYELAQGLLNSLLWRAPGTVQEHTAQLIRQHVDNGHLEAQGWLSTLISLACVPQHPLNIDFLHRRLREWTLIERDTTWTKPVVWLWRDDDNAVTRTMDWLWGNCHRLDAETAANVARLLAWLLSSTSRRLRDSATKVLVEVSDTHPMALHRLLSDFEDVNDPYIRERLLAVALGHTTRLPTTDLAPTTANTLALINNAAVRMAAHPQHPPHALVTHYTRQVTAEAQRRLPGRDLDRYTEPTTGWPLRPPSGSTLRQTLGDVGNRYMPSSPVNYDFREYVLDRGIRQDFVPPDQNVLRRRRKANGRARYRRAVTALAIATGKSQQQIELIFGSRKPRRNNVNYRRMLATPERRPRLLSAEEQLRQLHPDLVHRLQRAQRDRFNTEPVRIDLDLIERFIIDRALDLGWRPTGQGGPDDFPNYDSRPGRAQDKVERIGKKYSWIAFHELVGVLTQHCTLQRRWQEVAPFDSIWQLPHLGDIDPTIALRGDAPAASSGSARLLARARTTARAHAWWLEGFHTPLRPPVEDDDTWLQATTDLPDPVRLLTARDPDGDTWIALESHTEWQLDIPGAAYQIGPHRRDMWIRTQSYLAPASALDDIRRWSAGKNWMGLWMPTPPDYGLGYYRQYPTGTPWQEGLRAAFEERSRYDAQPSTPDRDMSARYDALDGWSVPANRGFPAHPIALATFGRAVSADADMSGKDLPRGLLPSPQLLSLLDAEQTPRTGLSSPTGSGASSPDRLGLGGVEREYSWSDGEHVVMFGTDGWEWGSPLALFVRARSLQAALASKGLIWWTWVLGEKISWQRGDPTGDRLDLFGAAGLAGRALDVWSFDARFQGFGAREDDEGA